MYRTWLLILLSLTLAACAGRHSRGRLQKGRVPQGPQVLGTISMVNEELGFVLINTPASPDPGTQLNALTPDGGETAVLKVSPAQKRPFIIADIVNGTPHSGDEVRIKPTVVAPSR